MLRTSCTTGMSNSRGYVGRIGKILAGNFAAGRDLVTKEILANKNLVSDYSFKFYG